jgi:hypothetical protein
MLGRRRPLVRAAAVGGAGYAIGKRRARGEQEEEQVDEAPAQTGLSPEAVDELERLAKLKDEGVLTQEEFDSQKARILESS